VSCPGVAASYLSFLRDRLHIRSSALPVAVKKQAEHEAARVVTPLVDPLKGMRGR
jgi:hypothetical protein